MLLRNLPRFRFLNLLTHKCSSIVGLNLMMTSLSILVVSHSRDRLSHLLRIIGKRRILVRLFIVAESARFRVAEVFLQVLVWGRPLL